MTFSGFRSRWTMPRSCAAARPCAICAPSEAARALASGPSASRSRSVCPSTSSATVNVAALLAHVVNGEDVRVRERGDGARFGFEPRAALGIGGDVGGQRLDRDLAAEPRVACAIHVAHTAGAERREDFVGTEA
jgi:hypothetical protein